MHRCRFLAAALLAGALAFAGSSPSQAADHKDSPSVSTDPAADLADVFAFVNPNNHNVVLAATVNPFTPAGVPVFFAPDVLYQFKIDNTGDAREDLVIQVVFTPPGPAQRATFLGPAHPSSIGAVNKLLPSHGVQMIVAPANGTLVPAASGMKVFAGMRDDPFFLDNVFVDNVLAGLPVNRPPGIDFFRSLNVSVIAVEVPPDMLRGKLGNVIKVWVTTSRPKTTQRSANGGDLGKAPFVQKEREGNPNINAIVVPPARHDEYNRSIPSDDLKRFGDDAVGILLGFNGDRAYSEGLVKTVMPDVLTLDMTSLAGFGNGRRPEDDINDILLAEATHGRFPGDNVNQNDVPFLPDFPFFAPPHDADEAVPARAKNDLPSRAPEPRYAAGLAIGAALVLLLFLLWPHLHGRRAD